MTPSFLNAFVSSLFFFHQITSQSECNFKIQGGLKEWVNSQPLENVVWQLEKVCHSYKTCFGSNFTGDMLPQIAPLLTQANAIVVFQSSSPTLKYYKTDEDGFRHCKLQENGGLVNPSNVPTNPGSNYFLANDTAYPWIECQFGLRLNITIQTFKCSSPSSPSSLCSNRGKCVTSPYQNSYECSCCEKYNGNYCERVDGCFSKTPVCLNGGYCRDGPDTSNTLSSYLCLCSEGYTGKNCAEEDIGTCRRNECMNGGECTEDNSADNGFTCLCADGFQGQACEQEKNECLTLPCKNGGRCVDGVNKYTCQCLKDFSGWNCEVDGRPCRTGVCKNGGTCEEEEDGGRVKVECFCSIGFSGVDCSIEGISCLPNPCLHSTECIAYTNHSYTCICQPGYTGKVCDTSVDASMTSCASKPCKDTGRCIEVREGFQCRCEGGGVWPNCAEVLSNNTVHLVNQPNSETLPPPAAPPYAFIVIGIIIIIIILILIILLILYLNRRKSPPPYQPYSVSGGIQMKERDNPKNPSSASELFQDDAYPDETISYISTLSSSVSSDADMPVVKRNVSKNVVA